MACSAANVDAMQAAFYPIQRVVNTDIYDSANFNKSAIKLCAHKFECCQARVSHDRDFPVTAPTPTFDRAEHFQTAVTATFYRVLSLLVRGRGVWYAICCLCSMPSATCWGRVFSKDMHRLDTWVGYKRHAMVGEAFQDNSWLMLFFDEDVITRPQRTNVPSVRRIFPKHRC